MTTYQKPFTTSTSDRLDLLDVTDTVTQIVSDSKIKTGICHVAVAHSTAAILSNENEVGLKSDFIKFFKFIDQLGPYNHDQIDNNASAHLLSGIIGQSQSFTISNGRLQLGTWQNIFLAELDGPRSQRKVIITITGD